MAGIAATLALFVKSVRTAVMRCITRNQTDNRTKLALLRSEITNIYYKYLEVGTIPVYALENLTMVYKAYKDEGGNSFVDEIYKSMLDWKVVNK